MTRAEAKKKGLPRYFTGRPCKHGHVAERYTNNGTCVECVRIAANKYRAEHPERQWRVRNPEKAGEYKRRWNKENKEKVSEHHRRYYQKNMEKICRLERERYRREKMKGKSVTMRFQKPLLAKMERRKDGPLSRAFVRDIEDYYRIMEIGFRRVREKLTRNEARLILDVQNGASGDIETWLHGGLLLQVEDGIALDGLDGKWSVDAEALINKIKSMDRLEILALVDWCRVWWINYQDEEFVNRELSKFD